MRRRQLFGEEARHRRLAASAAVCGNHTSFADHADRHTPRGRALRWLTIGAPAARSRPLRTSAHRARLAVR
jgi:hypothetical protein